MSQKFLVVETFEIKKPDWFDAKEVEAYDFSDAAERAAEEMDCERGEAPSEKILWVKCVDGGKIKKFDMTFDICVDYTAHECTTKERQQQEGV